MMGAYKLRGVGVQGVMAGAWHIVGCRHLRVVVHGTQGTHCAKGYRLQPSKDWWWGTLALRYTIPSLTKPMLI